MTMKKMLAAGVALAALATVALSPMPASAYWPHWGYFHNYYNYDYDYGYYPYYNYNYYSYGYDFYHQHRFFH